MTECAMHINITEDKTILLKQVEELAEFQLIELCSSNLDKQHNLISGFWK